jgi:hypothetical protein
MTIGSLVKLKYDGRLAFVLRVCVNGNLGVWPLDGLDISGRRPLGPDCLIWTYSGQLESVL